MLIGSWVVFSQLLSLSLLMGLLLVSLVLPRGLRQGFPLSPFLFLLVAEGLSKLICNTRRSGELKGLKVSPSEVLSHLLFIDDVLLFGVRILPGIPMHQEDYGSLLSSYEHGN
jgi:hypothetical protein